MALINCSECDKSKSNQAANCPNCGVPIAFNNFEQYEYLLLIIKAAV